MNNILYDHGYRVKWTDVYVEKKQRYKTSVTDFHEHGFYEINLVLSGNVNAFVVNHTIEGSSGCLVMTKPNTPHFVSCKSDTLYSSLYLVFSEEFIKSYDIQFANLMSVFGDRGMIFELAEKQKEKCAEVINNINEEENSVRKRLLVFYLLSYIDEISQQYPGDRKTVPECVYKALEYIENHYMEKIVAQELADIVHVGRTTLMTQFKKYVGETLHEYILQYRLRKALWHLNEGKTEYEAAIYSGFSDNSALIQSFKRKFNMTPIQYMKNIK